MLSNSIAQVFGIEKPVIGMAHLKALPGSPLYNPSEGIDGICALLKTTSPHYKRAGSML
jgi:predicted TIM-barrel enzyme